MYIEKAVLDRALKKYDNDGWRNYIQFLCGLVEAEEKASPLVVHTNLPYMHNTACEEGETQEVWLMTDRKDELTCEKCIKRLEEIGYDLVFGYVKPKRTE